MSQKARRRAGPPALDLIETAVHLLRTAPAGVLLAYYAGSIPCVLGVLYFWADMSRGAFAHEHLIEASLSTALLYVWMKCWHTVFASKLHAHLVHGREEPWTLGRVARMVLTQTAIQPTGLFVRLLAAQVIIPYVWTYGFYQNVGILGDGTRGSIGEVVREAARQAGFWLRQAHLVLTCLFGFAFFVWLNVGIAFRMVPALVKMFFGIETMLTRDPWLILNTTTIVASLGVTYLCFDPIRKAVFLLRCFHGASLQSGEDLRVELNALSQGLRTAAVALIFTISLLGGARTARAAEPPPAAKIESSQLNDSVERVLQRREYAWRLPRSEKAEEEQNQGWLATFVEELWKRMVRLKDTVAGWLEKVMDWLKRMFDREPKVHESSSGSGVNWSAVARGTLYVLAALLVVVLGVLLWRWGKGRRVEIAVAQATPVAPDLNEENVTADQLPEDGWLRLARELMDKGDLRLALRAFYLATLAHLGHRELIRLARHKSNRDYDRELQRRARGNASLLGAFDENLLVFERAWYGEHDVTPMALDGFSQNIERIRTC